MSDHDLPPADEKLDMLVRRAEHWLTARPHDGDMATMRTLVTTVQSLRLEVAEQGEHVAAAQAILAARREADTAEIETLRAELSTARRIGVELAAWVAAHDSREPAVVAAHARQQLAAPAATTED